jgi:hypothetical protein
MKLIVSILLVSLLEGYTPPQPVQSDTVIVMNEVKKKKKKGKKSKGGKGGKKKKGFFSKVFGNK